LDVGLAPTSVAFIFGIETFLVASELKLALEFLSKIQHGFEVRCGEDFAALLCEGCGTADAVFDLRGFLLVAEVCADRSQTHLPSVCPPPG
jgi:hypothetical protein